jgi:hypothetical protein
MKTERDDEERLPHNISSAAMLADQKFAVVVILSDLRKCVVNGDQDPEPCIAFLGVYPTEEAATRYAKFTASKQYPKCDIDVVQMYMWEFPENIHPDSINEIYGHERLNEIMASKKENTKISKEFEGWCSDNGVKPNVTDI